MQRLGRTKELRPRVLIDQCTSSEAAIMPLASYTVHAGYTEDTMM